MRHRPRPRILFVSHQASRTGAPLFLLYFLRWLRDHSDLDFEVLILTGGPLEEEFRQLAPVRVLRKDRHSSLAQKIETALDYFGVAILAGWVRGLRYRPRLRRLGPFDICYLNSTVSFRIIRYFPRRWRSAVIGHVHELDLGFKASLPRGRSWSEIFGSIDRVLACSDAVASYMLKEHDLPADRVSRHYEFIELPTPPSEAETETWRVKLRLPPEAAIVGAVGTFESRKAPDLFVQLASSLKRRRPLRPVIFVWVGARGDERDFHLVRHDIEAAGVEDVIRLLPPVIDMRPFYALFDVLVVTSREDPFPLVCLEAAAQGTPVVSFDNGGITEFLLPDSGLVVPFLDVEGMADAVERLLNDDRLYKKIAASAASKVAIDHSVQVGAPRLLDEIEQVLMQRRERAGP